MIAPHLLRGLAIRTQNGVQRIANYQLRRPYAVLRRSILNRGHRETAGQNKAVLEPWKFHKKPHFPPLLCSSA
jgi:hypothetical protein